VVHICNPNTLGRLRKADYDFGPAGICSKFEASLSYIGRHYLRFLDMAPKVQTTTKKDKMNYIKLKNVCSSKDTINRKGGEEENICESYT
jgi:hypothetical protein